MQSTVSNNLLNTISSSKNPQLPGGPVQNNTQTSVNESADHFELLVTEQINTQISGGLHPGLQQGIQENVAKNSGNLAGNVLPYGNQQAAIPQALLREQLPGQVAATAALQNNSVLQDGLVGARIAADEFTVDKLKLGVTNTGLAKNDADSLLSMSASDNRFAKNLFAQQSIQNNINNFSTNSIAMGDRVLNQFFVELMESGSTLNNLNTQSNMKQGDVSLKTLLSLSSNEGANQPDLIRTDSNGSFTNASNNATSKPILNMMLPPSNVPAWQQSFGEKVMWMINQNIHSAEIKLNPPELGRLDIKISMQQQDQTAISFTSQNQQVREMIESALPRLREMLGDSGLNLSDVDVSDKSFTAKNGRDQFASNDQPGEAEVETSELENKDNSESGEVIEQQLYHAQESGRIDFYA